MPKRLILCWRQEKHVSFLHYSPEITLRKRFGEKNECSLVWLHQPKSLFETSLLVVKDSTSAIRRKKIRLKTELEKTKDELKATKDNMRKTINYLVQIPLGIMRNCVNITLGFQTFVTTFPILLHHIVFSGFFRGTLKKWNILLLPSAQ